jgi:L-cystine uptake protein TcyP (sodium:dicarboxylate symporter family)
MEMGLFIVLVVTALIALYIVYITSPRAWKIIYPFLAGGVVGVCLLYLFAMGYSIYTGDSQMLESDAGVYVLLLMLILYPIVRGMAVANRDRMQKEKENDKIESIDKQ